MTTKYITDQKGRKQGVLLSVREYRMLLDAYEELQDIKAYDEAKAQQEEVVSFEQVKLQLLQKGLL